MTVAIEEVSSSSYTIIDSRIWSTAMVGGGKSDGGEVLLSYRGLAYDVQCFWSHARVFARCCRAWVNNGSD